MQKKIYNKKSEKIIDFLLGLMGAPVIFGITPILASKLFYSFPFFYNIHQPDNMGALGVYTASWPGFGIVFAAELAAAAYIGIKRKFIGIGLLFSIVVIPLVVAGGCMLLLSGGSMFN